MLDSILLVGIVMFVFIGIYLWMRSNDEYNDIDWDV